MLKLNKDNFFDLFIFVLFSALVINWVLFDHKVVFITTLVIIPVCFLLIILCYYRVDVNSTKKSLLWLVLGFSILLLFSYNEAVQVSKSLETAMLGIAGSLISLGLIGVILQFKDTKDYFAEALSELVIEEKYINKLSHEQLKSLQKKILERIFDNNGELDRENSFYKFYNRKIESFIGQPYRENYHNTIAISEHKESLGNDGKKYLISDTVSYQCRTMGSKLNTNVRWVASKDEIDNLDEFYVCINKKQIFNKNSISNLIEDQLLENGAVLKKFTGIESESQGVEFHLDFSGLKDEAVKDGCIVSIHAIYKSTNFKTIAAKLLDPTKDYTLTVTHPTSLKSKVEVYGYEVTSKYYEHRDYSGGFSVSFRSWLLPESGVYIAFEEKSIIESSDKNKENNNDGNCQFVREKSK